MMIVYYIVENKHVEERLRSEISETFVTPDDMTYDNLKKMKYIDCIQEEVTRIYGPGTGAFLR
jgi:cytochrome P450